MGDNKCVAGRVLRPALLGFLKSCPTVELIQEPIDKASFESLLLQQAAEHLANLTECRGLDTTDQILEFVELFDTVMTYFCSRDGYAIEDKFRSIAAGFRARMGDYSIASYVSSARGANGEEIPLRELEDLGFEEPQDNTPKVNLSHEAVVATPMTMESGAFFSPAGEAFLNNFLQVQADGIGNFDVYQNGELVTLESLPPDVRRLVEMALREAGCETEHPPVQGDPGVVPETGKVLPFVPRKP